MAGADRQQESWKERFFHEMAEYGINVIYLALVFAAFTQYRRLVLAAHDIIYTNYWVAVIQALILGKVIMIGAVFHAGRGLERRPLIYPTLYKALVFTLLVVSLNVIEHAIEGLWTGKGLAGGFAEFVAREPHELLSGSLVLLVALIPFFAVKELGRGFGRARIRALLFHERTGQFLEGEK
ncbi:MAG: hypothetical protein IPK44_06120 [Candidatus Accumulibacter sp.]|jgi:hypothetical protein|uniref:hypothetical protein n=2 Tax=Candidatus Accumulibacter TaxID=327159 RepID=UPI00208D36BA|nr:hypothetical protein [Accumulibacter sp.]MBK8114141.1 hypothetical protein [Accumulibacter sp.]MBK8577328.1 hypothetical protein [Candidatus Accumulibacter propinquus]